MSDELKPCPFCEMNDWRVWEDGSASCQSCGAEVVIASMINTRPIEDALLEACEEVINLFANADITIGRKYSMSASVEEFMSAQDSIIAAIAKARGEAEAGCEL